MTTAKGVDVSHWQSLGDWSTAGLSFIIVKASEGTSTDPMFSSHASKARSSGLVVGAYAFNRDDVDIAAQAKTFAEASASADLFFIDVEGEHAFTQAQTRAFMDAFRSITGKHIGLYHSASGYFDAGQDYDWVAHWGVVSPSISWDFHQYRGSPLDLDQYNGTDAQLRDFVAGLNGGISMPTLSAYLPGYKATVGTNSRIRVEPSLTATTIRTTTRSETWVVTGWAVGASYDGSTKWLCRWSGSRWEYTHESNVTTQPTAQQPTATDCKVFSDAAYEDGQAAGYANGYSMGSTTGYAQGKAEGYNEGYIEGYAVGEATGYENGDAAGFARGKSEGLAEGESIGIDKEQERVKGVLGLE